MGGSASVPNSTITTENKDTADTLYSEGRYFQSALHYTAAINNEYALISNDIHSKHDDSNDTDHDDSNVYDNLEDINSRLRSRDILSKLFCNRSAAFLQCNNPSKALEDALGCININSTWFKGYYRAAKALLSLGRVNEAKDYIEKAIALLPDDEDLMILYDEITKSDGTNTESDTSNTTSKSDTRKSLGQIYSWGLGKGGATGHGNQKDKNFPTMIDALKEKHIIDADAGTMHSVCLVSSGELYVFGSNSHGQLGLGVDKDCALFPVLQPKLIGVKIKAVQAGAGHTIAITTDGKCYGWGINKQGQLGLGDSLNDNIYEPTLIPDLSNKETMCVSCGIAHTFFLLRNGTLLSCGLNQYGQLGLGLSDQSVWIPTEVIIPTSVTGIKHIACGGVHSLLVDNERRVYACGSNSCAQLGMEDCKDINEFKLIISLSTLQAAYVSCGEEFSSLITTTKSVYVWGLGLHNGNLETNSTPTCVKELEGLGIETLSCSQKLIMAVARNGDVFSWGIVDDRPDIGTGIDVTNIKKPEKITSFGKHKRIRQLVCGRKHFIGITIGAYGPFCFITKGLQEFDVTELTCDSRMKFQIKSIDNNDQAMDTGGSIFRVHIDHEIADYDIRLRKLQASDDDTIKRKLAEQVIIDDNMDGTYDGVMNLVINGKYRITITLNELEIKGSPFEVNCLPGIVCPSNCISYFGKFADFNTLFNESGSVKLICNCDDGIVFTVSCFDRYGNKCTDIANTSIIVKCESTDAEVNSTETYTRGSNGIFPCILHAPKETGMYRVSVYVDSIDSHKHIRGSPYSLTVNPKQASALVDDNEKDLNNQVEEFLNNNNNANDDNQYNEEDQKLITLTKMEMTRKRSMDALRKRMNEMKVAKEMKRRQTVKRVGGGFAIKYSNEV